MKGFEPPYLGAAYYPEDWDESEIDKDIQRMKGLGVNAVRIAEFAWYFMEPEEGKYEFGWLHNVVKKLTDAGIAVVMCTPTATPPAWLTGKYPETLAVMPTGQKFSHGGRRHYCPNSPVYGEFSRKITQNLAQEFKDYPSIVAWQLDNEFSCHINACYCDECKKGFQKFLKEIYGTIDNLNNFWGTGVWSIKFNSFEEIPLPVPAPAAHHPSLIYYFKFFMSRSYSDFAREQTDIIRKYTKAPITTNGMPPFHELDYEDLFSTLDFASNDIYYPPQDMHKICAELDWMRPLKNRPYWVMETSATWGGGLIPGAIFSHNPGSLRAKCWLFYALGGEAVSFWLWRAHWSGQEMEHGSLVYGWGEPTLAEKEIRAVSTEIKKLKDFLVQTKPEKAEVALHFSYPSSWVYNMGSLIPKFNYMNSFYEFYRMLVEKNIHRDIIFPHADVSKYKVVLSPYMAVIPEQTIKQMEKFVRNGGIWIIGPMSAYRNEHCTAFKEGAYGPLEKLIGARVRHRFPSAPKGGRINLAGYKNTKCTLWCDAFIALENTKVIATYADGPAKGTAAIIETLLGRGRIITIGTQLSTPQFSKWLTSEIKKTVSFKPSDAVIVKRVDDKNTLAGIIAIDIRGKGTSVSLDREGVELLSGKKVTKKLTLPSYGVAVIKF